MTFEELLIQNFLSLHPFSTISNSALAVRERGVEYGHASAELAERSKQSKESYSKEKAYSYSRNPANY